jgi:hypothetical protein
VVHNYTNWRVCSQWPAADEEVEGTTVYFDLARPGGCSE